MTNCIFYSAIFALFLNFTMGSIRYSQVNRTFMSIYRGVFEASTITVNSSGDPVVPYYNEELLETYLVQYFKENLKNYVTDYEVRIYFFNRENDSLCFTHECRDINLTLKADINTFFKFEKSQDFSVFERGELWMKN